MSTKTITKPSEAEKSARRMHNINLITMILAKIAEVAHWLLVVVVAFFAICSITRPSWFGHALNKMIDDGDTSISCYGFESNITVWTTADDYAPSVNYGAVTFFTLGGMVVLSLMAMVFRNAYLILKTAQGKTNFSKGHTPFQKDVVRMLREIGLFLIAVSVLSLISDIIVQLGGNSVQAGFNYESGFMGLLFVCISQFFAYGAGLEEEVDGLV